MVKEEVLPINLPLNKVKNTLKITDPKAYRIPSKKWNWVLKIIAVPTTTKRPKITS